VSEFQSFIHARIRATTAPFLPIAILLFAVSAGIVYFIFFSDQDVTVVPRFFLAVPIVFTGIGIWLIYLWMTSLNVQNHGVSKLLFESPQDLKKLVVTKNLGNHRITFVPQDGHSSFLTVWNAANIDKLVDLVQQNTPKEIEIEHKNNLK